MLVYTKAIVAAVASVLAVIGAIIQGSPPDSIPGATEALIGIITTVLVFLLPNAPSRPEV